MKIFYYRIDIHSPIKRKKPAPLRQAELPKRMENKAEDKHQPTCFPGLKPAYFVLFGPMDF